MDSAAKVGPRRTSALAGLLDSLDEKEALATLAELLDDLPIGVALINAADPSLPLFYLNRQARTLAAAAAAGLAGKPFEEALAAPDEVVQAVREAREQLGHRRVRYRGESGQLWDFDAVRLGRRRERGARLLATWHEVPERSVENERSAPARRLAERLGKVVEHSELADVNPAQLTWDAALDVGGSLDQATVMERMLGHAADDADADLVLLLRREDDELVVEAEFDRSTGHADLSERPNLKTDSASRRALELREPVIESPEPLAGDPGTDLRLRDLRHSVRVPVPVQSEPSQLILLLGRRRELPFAHADAALLEVLARHVGIAMRNARLYERAQNTARRLQVGVDVALEVATRLEPEEVVDRILHRALEAVDAERAMLSRIENGLECTILGSVDRNGEPPPVGMSASLDNEEPAVQAITTRRPAQGRLSLDAIGARPLRWTVAIPLVVRGELVALLAVSRDPHRFDEEEVAVLQQIGAIAALAFKNATLFQSLRDASRLRSQFLNMAAHELRTPLAVIGGYISMLADGTLGPGPTTWEAPLSVLVDKTRELAHLIDDILLAGRLESGVARTTGCAMDLVESLRKALKRAAPRAELLTAEVDVRAPQSLLQVWADPDHVGRILDNLINNAFNYSPAPPRVSVTIETDAGSALIRVEDHGRGIGSEHRDRIFQQFYRVDDAAEGYPPGTGLGLFISRALAERYGGGLDLEWSEPSIGSRFVLRLPLSEAA
jgi:signal transduction histidine kinase